MLPKELIGATRCVSNQYADEAQSHGLGYHVVADCPSKVGNAALRRHCVIDVDQSQQLMLHYVFLEIDGIVYRNVFCARCHDADADRGQFWTVTFWTPKRRSACLRLAEMMKNHSRVELTRVKEDCNERGSVVPLRAGVEVGHTRMGKLCLVPSKETIVKREHLLHAPASSYGDPDEKESCYDAISAALARRHTGAETKPVGFFKLKRGFRAVAHLDEICRKCDALTQSLFSLSTEPLYPYLFPSEDGGFAMHSGKLTAFFDSASPIDCEEFEDCDEDDDDDG